MSGLSRMTGTPWHIGRYTRNQGDPRRHRSHCIHYRGKDNPICGVYNARCHGAAQCKYYKVSNKNKTEKKDTLTAKSISSSLKTDFLGVKKIPLKDIEINTKVAQKPSDKKVRALLNYYKVHGELDKPIVVSCHKDKYLLEDKYLRYYVAKMLKLDTIWAEMGSPEEIKERDEIRKVGALVWHLKKKEMAEVVDVAINRVTLKLDTGEIIPYDVAIALQCGIIRLL